MQLLVDADEFWVRLAADLGSATDYAFVQTLSLEGDCGGTARVGALRGARVTLLRPGANTHVSLTRSAVWQSARHDLDLRLYNGRMSHLKAMLVDGRRLVLGSSNFDRLSYHLHQDVVAVVTDRDLIRDFQQRVVARDLQDAARHDGSARGRAGRMAHVQLLSAAALSRAARPLADSVN